MSRVCPFCGKESLKPESRFCASCGQPLPDSDVEEPAAAPAQPRGEAPEPPPAGGDQLETAQLGSPEPPPSGDGPAEPPPSESAEPESPVEPSPPAPQPDGPQQESVTASAQEEPPPSSPDQPARPTQAQASSHPLLIIRVPGEAPSEVTLDRDVFTIGRYSDNDIVLAHNYVSGHHGRLESRDGVWHYIDLGSTNGTYINGQRTVSAVLRDGDILRIGDLQGNSVGLTFRAAGIGDAAAPIPNIIGIGATELGMKSVLFIGRDPKADISLPAPIVSWQHARLDLTEEGHVLADLGSTNGTFVNGQRLAQPCLLQEGDIVQIGPFTLVYEASGFQQYAATAGVRLDGIQLERELGRGRRRRTILQGINLTIYPREFVAIVGTSGAGKSTLLMALNGFARATDGQVLVNGDDLYEQFDLYRTMVGYVPQDDIIHRSLTVSSVLRYAARLRLPPDTTAQEIERRIDQVLDQVEMAAQKDQVVSSLSGGQRKRVSIAVELLAEPNLFFLDEPTSGLDPGLEKKMMHTLRRLADGGRTVLLVTHATANIVQCDHVCFLSQGRMVYFGPPEEALGYFGVKSGDFADIYARLDDPDPKVARENAVLAEQAFGQSDQHRRYVSDRQEKLPEVRRRGEKIEEKPRPRVSIGRQFLILTRRYLDLVLRDRLLLAVLMAVMPIIGALVVLVSQANWLVDKQWREIKDSLLAELAKGGEDIAVHNIVADAQILLFIMTLAAVLLGLFAAVYEIVKEWSIYQRERMVPVRILPYIASKVVVLGIFALIQCLLFMLVIGLRIDYPAVGALLPAPVEMYITLVLATLAAILLGLLISAIVPNVNSVIYIVFLILFFQLIFAGVLFDLPGVTNQLSNLTLTRWTMEALGSSVDLEALRDDTGFGFQPGTVVQPVAVDVEVPRIESPSAQVVTVTQTITQTVLVEPEPMVLQDDSFEFDISYEPTIAHVVKDWLLLSGFGLVFALAVAVVLRRKDVR
jgi:ABC-type multidrug transport system ATPase subunit